MTIKTKIFGKKIKGEALEHLLRGIGENPEKILYSSSKKRLTKKVYGRVSFSPSKEAIKVDLYVHREDNYLNNCSIPLANILLPLENLHLFPESQGAFIQIYKGHFQGEIKYKNVSQTRTDKQN